MSIISGLRRHMLSFVFIITILLNINTGKACTGIRLKGENGSVVFARTLEFARNLKSQILLIPRGYSFRGITPFGENGLMWKAKFAAVGANFEEDNHLIDGFNEKGLYVGSFYFPGYTEYQKVNKKDCTLTIAPQQLINWILTNFENIKELKSSIQKIKVANVPYSKWNEVLPIHLIVTDAKGNSSVFEYVKGKLNIYNNPYGVLTNAPAFDWHILNITNYLNLSPNNIKEKRIVNKVFKPFGEGSGLSGIPGDFTPPSRFIRAFFLAEASIKTHNSEETVIQAFHILNSFDIPKGAIRSHEGNLIENDFTQWTSVSDLDNKCYYYKTEKNSRVRRVDLLKCNLNASDMQRFKMETGSEDILDVTGSLQ
jgi:choloylglycine hydrolase